MLQAWDESILQWIQHTLRGPFLDAVLPAITFLGDAALIWIAAAVLLMAIKTQRAAGAAVAVALLLSLLVGNCGIKPLVARLRPCDVDLSITLLIPHPGEFSFPSGHSMSSFAAATALFLYRKKWGAAALVLAALIGFSRLYLYVHYPTDVLAGALIGVGLAFLSRFLVERYRKKRAGARPKSNA